MCKREGEKKGGGIKGCTLCTRRGRLPLPLELLLRLSVRILTSNVHRSHARFRGAGAGAGGESTVKSTTSASRPDDDEAILHA